MRAGLAQYRVGTYSDGLDAVERPGQARVQFELPREGDESAQKCSHNRLMNLCGLSMGATFADNLVLQLLHSVFVLLRANMMFAACVCVCLPGHWWLAANDS